jgi:hypothetical protein
VKLYKYLTASRIDILQGTLIRFTQPSAFNDPFEMSPYIHAIGSVDYLEQLFAQNLEGLIQKAYHQQPFSIKRKISFKEFHEYYRKEDVLALIKEKADGPALIHARESLPIAINQAVGILSLSETPDNLLMWAHYADSHSGMVFEFDTHDDFFNQQFPKATGVTPVTFDEDLRKEYGYPRQVEYSKERPKLVVSEIQNFDPFLVKSCEWEYEKEWRMLMPLSYTEQKISHENNIPICLFKIPLSAISGVIFGQRASDDLVDRIQNIVRTTPEAAHIVMKKISLDSIEFKLCSTPIL